MKKSQETVTVFEYSLHYCARFLDERVREGHLGKTPCLTVFTCMCMCDDFWTCVRVNWVVLIWGEKLQTERG